VFLTRITDSSSSRTRRVLWDSPKPPILCEEDPFGQTGTLSDECIVRYVPLHTASALSIGFRSGAMFAIKYHARGQYDPSIYAALSTDIWVHYPLLLDENEGVLEVWSVTYKSSNQGICALVVGNYNLSTR
jgi:hypothetical protein